MRRLLCFKFGFLLLCASLSAHAVELGAKQSLDNVFEHGVLFAEDQVALDNPDSIAAASQLLTQALQQNPEPIREIPGGSWIGIPITNVGNSEGYWRLDTEMAVWEFTSRAYLIRKGKAELVFDAPGLELGVHEDVTVEPGQEVVASDVILLDANESAVIWFQYVTPSSSWERIGLLTLEDFSTNRVAQGQKNGLLFGAMVILTLFFLVFSAVLQFWPALYYGLFFLGATLLGLMLEGLLFVEVDLTLGSPFVMFSMTARLGAAVAYVQFMRSFLNIKVDHPRFDRIVQVYCWATPLVLAWNIWGYSDASIAVAVLGVFLLSIFQMVGGVIAYRSRVAGRGLYLAGTLLVFGLMALSFLALTDLLKWPTRLSNDISYLLGLADGLIFGAAIVTQAFALRRERDGALRAEVVAAEERLAATESMLSALQERDSAVQLADQRRQRLAAASHDLRQPLLSLEQSIQQLDGDNQGADQLREQLNTGLRYLNSVVGDNLEETRPDQLPAETEDPQEVVSVEMLFTNLERMFNADAQSKGLSFRLRPSELQVTGQPIDLIRMLVNLTANAIKFTESGGVLVTARKRGVTASLQVWDTGVGLEPREIDQMFEAYQKGKSENAGEGLGLAIVQDLALANGYGLAVKSEPGRGSVFTISKIPLAI